MMMIILIDIITPNPIGTNRTQRGPLETNRIEPAPSCYVILRGIASRYAQSPKGYAAAMREPPPLVVIHQPGRHTGRQKVRQAGGMAEHTY